jgi:hypothetical protein
MDEFNHTPQTTDTVVETVEPEKRWTGIKETAPVSNFDRWVLNQTKPRDIVATAEQPATAPTASTERLIPEGAKWNGVAYRIPNPIDHYADVILAEADRAEAAKSSRS